MPASVRQGVRLTALVTLTLGLALPTSGAEALRSTPAMTSAVTSTGLPRAAEPGDGRPVGEWTVVPHGDGDYTVRWTSPTTLPVTDDRAVFTQEGADVA